MEQAPKRIVVALILLSACVCAGVVVLFVTQPQATFKIGVLVVAAATVLTVATLAILLVVVRSGRTKKAKPSSGETVAQRLGFTYEASAPRNFHHDFGPLPGVPSGGDVRHVFRGMLEDRQLVIFQHGYVVSTGQAVIPVNHAVYLTSAPAWPSVTVARRGLFGRLLFRLGRQRGLLLEDPAFNSAFRIKTDDEGFALMLLHPEMQEFLREKPSVTWRIHIDCVALIYSGSIRMDRLEASLARLQRFWELVPTELESW